MTESDIVTSMGKRSSLRIRNAMQRNRTRTKSAIKETRGSLAQWKLHVLDCKPSQA